MKHDRDVLADHGTELMKLRPANVIQAAQADMKRRMRNSEIGVARGDHHAGDAYEPYAFHRDHVRRAIDPYDLLIRALMDPTRGLESDKTNTRLIYRDAALLLQAIKMCNS